MSDTAASVSVQSYRPRSGRGTLRGYATLRVAPWRVDLRGVAYHVSTSDTSVRWLEMPHRLKPGTGGAGKLYTLRWISAADWHAFRASALAALATCA